MLPKMSSEIFHSAITAYVNDYHYTSYIILKYYTLWCVSIKSLPWMQDYTLIHTLSYTNFAWGSLGLLQNKFQAIMYKQEQLFTSACVSSVYIMH